MHIVCIRKCPTDCTLPCLLGLVAAKLATPLHQLQPHRQHRSELACCQREGDDSWVHYSSADTGRSQPGSAAATKGLDGPHDYSPSDDNSDCLWTAVYHKPVDLTDFKKQIGTATAVWCVNTSVEFSVPRGWTYELWRVFMH